MSLMKCIFSIDGHNLGMQSDIERVCNYVKLRDKQNTASIIKTSLGERIIKLDTSEDRINMLKDIIIENIPIEAQVKKRLREKT